MNKSTPDELLRQIRGRLTLACVALVVIALVVLIPELYEVNVGVRVAAIAVPLAILWYVRWLREVSSVKPPPIEQTGEDGNS